MNLEQLLAFRTIVEEKGVTAAARRLGLTQPAVTARLRALERACGQPLFERRGNRLVPTAAGLELLRRAQGLLESWEELTSHVRESGALRRGLLRLGADGPFGVMELVAAMRRSYPGLRVSLEIGNTGQVMERLAAAMSDAAVVTLEGPPEERWHRLLLGRERLVALLPAADPLAARKSLEPAELAARPVIFREPGSATRRLFESVLRGAGVEITPLLELGSREAVREAVASGLGASAVLEGEQPADSRLRTVAFAGVDPGLERWLICARERCSLRLMEALFAQARRPSRHPTEARNGG